MTKRVRYCTFWRVGLRPDRVWRTISAQPKTDKARKAASSRFWACEINVQSGRFHVSFFNSSTSHLSADKRGYVPYSATPPPPSSSLCPPSSISIFSSNPASTGQPGNAAASIGASKPLCSASATITASALAT